MVRLKSLGRPRCMGYQEIFKCASVQKKCKVRLSLDGKVQAISLLVYHPPNGPMPSQPMPSPARKVRAKSIELRRPKGCFQHLQEAKGPWLYPDSSLHWILWHPSFGQNQMGTSNRRWNAVVKVFGNICCVQNLWPRNFSGPGRDVNSLSLFFFLRAPMVPLNASNTFPKRWWASAVQSELVWSPICVIGPVSTKGGSAGSAVSNLTVRRNWIRFWLYTYGFVWRTRVSKRSWIL